MAGEKGVDFVLDFFKAEGVPLLLQRSRSFVDLRAATRDAIQQGACALGVDSITHFWQELFTAGMAKPGARLQKIGRIKEEWAPFSQDFQDSPIHFLVTGRLGFVWEESEIENERGEITKEVSKSGTKIKAEGDFGHEPDLEIEMSTIEDTDFIRFEKVRGRSRRTFKSQMLHVATLKKSRVWALNGKAFSWKDQPGYKPGYYKSVAECFKPHFDTINIGGVHHVEDLDRPSSDILFQQGSEQSYYEQLIKKTIALEKWDATMGILAGGQTKENIAKRQIIGAKITGTRSRTEFERQPLPAIEQQVAILLVLEHALKLKPAKTDDELLEAIETARMYIDDNPSKDLTLLEAMQIGKTHHVEAEPLPF